jgi:hypothetical protein
MFFAFVDMCDKFDWLLTCSCILDQKISWLAASTQAKRIYCMHKLSNTILDLIVQTYMFWAF